MAVNKNILKLGNIVGNYRNFLSSRIILPSHQRVATLKQTVEEKIGLPAKPKKPLTAYFRFMKHMRPEIVGKNPNLKLVEITKLLAQEWQKADASVKEKFEKEYQKSFEEYQMAKINYLSSITDEQKKLIEDAKNEAQLQKEKRLHKQTIKNLGKPKRPAAAVYLYLRSVGAKRGNVNIGDWQKSMIAKWEALPQEERQVYEIEAAKASEEYKKNLKLWEKKMTESGDYDIARYGVELNSEQKKSKKPTE